MKDDLSSLIMVLIGIIFIMAAGMASIYFKVDKLQHSYYENPISRESHQAMPVVCDAKPEKTS